MLKLTLEEVTERLIALERVVQSIAPVAEPAPEPPPPEKKTTLTPKMLDFLRRQEEERVRLGLPKGPTLAEQMPNTFASTCVLPEDAASQVDHYLYGHPKR
jgi:hypothetical protein